MGWARANLLYDTISSPPDPGSLKEAVCVLVQRGRADQEFFKTAALLSEVGSKGREEYFEQYKHALFPYVAKAAAKESARQKALLDHFYLAGPIMIRPE